MPSTIIDSATYRRATADGIVSPCQMALAQRRPPLNLRAKRAEIGVQVDRAGLANDLGQSGLMVDWVLAAQR